MKKAALIAPLALACATAAAAQQQSTDWELLVDPERRLTVATTAFDSGLAVGVRCMNGSFQVLLAGLPPAEGETRRIGVTIGDDEEGEPSRWNVATNSTTALSTFPAPLAREMREGGRMQVLVPDGAGQGRNLRHVVELPVSNTAVDEVLTACGRPLRDARDDEIAALEDTGLPKDIQWARPPRAEYPAGRTYTRGFATLTCLTQSDGRVTDCVVETEHPHDGGFGKVMLDSMKDARVRNNLDPNGPVPTGLIAFQANFTMEESSSSGSRIRRR